MVKTGISTASFFLRKNTEDALKFLSENKVEVSEVFLATYSEYCQSFADVLLQNKGGVEINSIHVLNTQFEPQLFSKYPRQKQDAFNILQSCMEVAKTLNAKYYTFHGVARVKKTPLVIDFDRVGKITNEIIERCSDYGVTLTFENVHWAYYNYIGFFGELKKRCPSLKGCLDIKQARQSGILYKDFVEEMGKDIKTVHVSDVNKDGKMCLPGKGEFDFDDLFKRLLDKGFDGAILIEAYGGDYEKEEELFESLMFLEDKAKKYFG